MIPLPMAREPGPPRKACTECGRCCTYVSVGINAPARFRYASDILWYLYHDRVSVYRDGTGDWFVVFEARCRHLQEDLLCRVYADRPLICRTFDDTTCEVNSPEGGRSFEDPRDFLEFLRTEHPGVHARLLRGYVPAELKPTRHGGRSQKAGGQARQPSDSGRD